MLYRKTVLFILTLYFAFIVSAFDCVAMQFDLPSDSDLHSSGYTPRWKETPNRFTLFPEGEELVVESDEFNIKRPLNHLINTSLENNADNLITELGYLELNIPSRKTAFLTYHKLKDDKAIFFDNLDAKFINYTPRNMRRFQWWLDKSLQAISGIFCGLAPLGVVPPIMAAGGIILDNFIPKNSGTGQEFAWMMAGFMFPSCIAYGCKWARDLRDYAYPMGFEQNTEGDGKPQYFPINWKVRFLHRIVAGATVVLRAAPALTYLWVIEEKVSRYTHSSDGLYWAAGATVPYFCGYLRKSYDFSMDSQERAYIRRQNEATKVAGIKKLLNHQLQTLKILVNGDENDDLVMALDKEFRKTLREKKLYKEIEDIINYEENNDFCYGCFDWIYRKLGYHKTTNEVLTDVLSKYAKEEIKEKKQNNRLRENIDMIISKHINGLLSDHTTAYQINASIQHTIEKIVLEYDLDLILTNFLGVDEETLKETIYQYITNRNLKEDKKSLEADRQLLEEDRKILEKNRMTIKENERIVEENERIIKEDRKSLEKNRKALEENRKALEENKKILKKEKKFLEEKEKILGENNKLKKENEPIIKKINELENDERLIEQISQIISSIINVGNREMVDNNKRIELLLSSINDMQRQYPQYSRKGNQDIAKSAVSLLFTRYIGDINYDKQLETIAETARYSCDTLHEGTELLQAVSVIKNSNIEGMHKRLYDEDNLPPEPPTRQWLARMIQGAAIPGRFIGTLFPFKEIILNSTALSWIGYCAGLLNIPLSHIETRDLLKTFYTNLPSIGKLKIPSTCDESRDILRNIRLNDAYYSLPLIEKLDDFYLLRGLGKLIATIPSAAFCLPQVGIIFTMGEEFPLYLKALLSVLVVQAEFPVEFSFHNTYWQEIITAIVTCDLPERIEDHLPHCIKVARAQTRMNQLFSEIGNDLNKFNVPTSWTFYNRMTGIDNK